MTKIITLLLSFITFFSINAQKSFTISGKLSGFEENASVKIIKNNITLDSCILKDGNFLLKGTLENTPSSVVLFINNGKKYKYSDLFIDHESITINAKIDDFKWDVKTKNSKYDDLRYTYFQHIKDLSNEREKLETEIFTTRDNGKWNDSLQVAYWNVKEPFGKIILVDKKLEEVNKNFITKNINSYYGLYLLETNKSVLSKEFITTTFKKLKPELRKTAFANSINSYLNNPDLKIGDKFYDFLAFDQLGRKVKFSNFFHKKYILLDFSTPYCGFCIQSIPILNKLIKENSNQLEIVTFYVDKDLKGFQKLNQKHPDWLTIWDKDGRLGGTYSKYKVDGTPVFYLFSPNGKLVEKFDGFDEELGASIAKKIKNPRQD